MKRKLLRLLGLLLLAGVGFSFWQVARLQAPAPAPHMPLLALDADALAKRLGEALMLPTISAAKSAQSEAEAEALAVQQAADFAAFHARLATLFPRVHAQLPLQRIGAASLLYRWPGQQDCPGWLFAAHQDVVPVEAGTEADWQQPPFSGRRVDDVIWGRGAIDDKGSLMALLEAAEYQLAQGLQPRCPIYLAFGHDEEIGGMEGARAIAAWLSENRVVLDFVLDEGGAITQGTVPGIIQPLAIIGVAEKGYLSLRLRSRDAGGHSSMPPRRTAIGRLAQAVARLEEQRPTASLGRVQRELLKRLAPHMAWPQRWVLSNLWLTEPLVLHSFAAVPATDATLRTTTAPTVFHAGVKDNILAQRAEAVINFRIQPGDSIAEVIEHVSRVVDDPDIEIEPLPGFQNEPTATADWGDPAFLRIERAVRAVSPEPELIVAPYVTSAGTDARHYAALTPRLYRFLPVRLSPALLASFHGSNENIPLPEYLRMVRFYIAMFADSAAVAPERAAN